MTFKNLLLDATLPVATLTVNRPQVLNALDKTTLDELARAVKIIGRTKGVRCAIVTGAGPKAFVAGADIAALSTMKPAAARLLAHAGHRAMTAMEASPVPFIAAVNGFALGGGFELALACDFIIASGEAQLGFPEVGLGAIPGFGGTQRLTRRIGLGRARELIYTGRLLTAEEAVLMGLVNEVTDPGALLGRAREIGMAIAARGPQAVAAAKRAIGQGADRPLAAGLALEVRLFSRLFGTADLKEGMRAFLEKRPAKFQGR